MRSAAVRNVSGPALTSASRSSPPNRVFFSNIPLTGGPVNRWSRPRQTPIARGVIRLQGRLAYPLLRRSRSRSSDACPCSSRAAGPRRSASPRVTPRCGMRSACPAISHSHRDASVGVLRCWASAHSGHGDGLVPPHRARRYGRAPCARGRARSRVARGSLPDTRVYRRGGRGPRPIRRGRCRRAHRADAGAIRSPTLERLAAQRTTLAGSARSDGRKRGDPWAVTSKSLRGL